MHYVGMGCGQPLYTKPPKTSPWFIQHVLRFFSLLKNLMYQIWFIKFCNWSFEKGTLLHHIFSPFCWALPWCATITLQPRLKKMESAKWLGDEPEWLGGRKPRVSLGDPHPWLSEGWGWEKWRLRLWSPNPKVDVIILVLTSQNPGWVGGLLKVMKVPFGKLVDGWVFAAGAWHMPVSSMIRNGFVEILWKGYITVKIAATRTKNRAHSFVFRGGHLEYTFTHLGALRLCHPFFLLAKLKLDS